MTSLALIALTLVAVALAEVFFPGRDLYHFGWFNVGVAALVIIVLASAKKRLAGARAGWAPAAAVIVGASIAGAAVVANGLFAPDNRTVVGAPGQRVRVDDAGGFLEFPLVQPDSPDERNGVGFDGPPLQNFVLKTVDRSVVAVEAKDLHGAHLTVTQPTGVAFLSPVLLMQQRQTIAGINLPFDSFAVPAAHRVVKAVVFTPQQAAMLRGMEGLEVPAVLFAVDDENDRPLRNSIALSVGGQTVSVGGLLLRAAVLQYPSVDVIAVPPKIAVALGTLLVACGVLWEFAAHRASIRRMAAS